MIGGIVLGVFVVIAVIFLLSGIRIVRPVEIGLIERLGKYSHKAEEGFHWIIPIIDRMIQVNITENMVDVEPQEIITKDDLNATVDAVVYFKVDDPYKAVYKARNFKRQIASLARTTLRNIIGDMTLSDANSKRDELNKKLEKELDKQTDAWGIDVIRVELQRIEPPEDVQEAMNKVVKAEREKKAAVDLATAEETKADGTKRAKIKEAEGMKKSQILKAEGEAEAIKQVAKANAEKIKLENEALQKYFKKEAQVYEKLKTAKGALAKGTKFVIDSKSNISTVITDAAGVTPIKDNTA